MSGTIDTGSEAWLLTSAALVMFMIPSLCLFYGGAVSERAVVHTMMLSFGALACGSILWSLVGYSLAFGGSDPGFGNLQFAPFFAPDTLRAGTSISEHAFFVFQMVRRRRRQSDFVTSAAARAVAFDAFRRGSSGQGSM